MKRLFYGLLVLLALAHQDFWLWGRIGPGEADRPLFGFLPIGLAYHIAVSIVAAILWAMAVKYCWPSEVEVQADVAGGLQPAPKSGEKRG